MAVLCRTAPGLAYLQTRIAGILGARLRLVRQPKTGQRHARETDAEFLQRPAARDRLSQAFGQFIEFVVHNFPFVLLFCFSALFAVPDDHPPTGPRR